MSYAEKIKGVFTGIWIAARLIDGKRKRKRFETKALADAWEAVVDATGKAPIEEGKTPHVEHPLVHVIRRARAEKEGWKNTRDNSLDQRLYVIVSFFGGRSSCESVTNEKLQEFVKHLEERKGRKREPLSGASINRYLAVVSGLLEYARLMGWTSHSPYIPWQDEAEGRVHFFTEEMEDALLGLLSPIERICYRSLLQTGMRAAELFEHLTPRKVDVSGAIGFIRLDASETKSKKPENLPIEIGLAKTLKAVLERSELPSHHTFYLAIKRACKTLGYDEELCIHSIRHTTGTRAAQSFDGPMVQNIMRHASYQTTQKYVHLNDKDKVTVLQALIREPSVNVRLA